MDKSSKAVFDANAQCCDIMNNLIKEETMKKINVAELLRNCPKGMELDCTICNGVKFIELDRNPNFPIVVRANNGYEFSLTKYGQVHNIDDAKCVIFPKGKTTWKEFHKPFKDGDIIRVRDEYSDASFTYVAILQQIGKGGQIYAHCFYNYEEDIFSTHDYLCDGYNIRFATEEEKAKLFQEIKDNGYKWNEETKTLEKLIEPKFKVGDRVYNKNYKDYIYDIHDIIDKGYRAKEINADCPIIILFGSQEDNYELVPNKFDINTLKPFESRVLVRDSANESWEAAFFGYYKGSCEYLAYSIVGGIYWRCCIPYEGNENLLGKTDDCDEFYKTWK